MKKVINVRFPVLYAAALSAGILFATLSAYFKFDGIWLLLPVAVALTAGVAIGLFKKKAGTVLIILTVSAVFAIGAVYCCALVFSYTQKEVFTDGAVMIYGTVTETGISSGGNSFIVIDKVRFGDTAINGKLIAYFLENAGDYCRRGYSVSFYSQPELISFFSDGTVNYNAANGVKYTCVIAGGLEAKYGFSLFGEIAYAIENMLYANADAETAAVSLAMLTGNSDMISAGTLTSFRYGGIAHVFAVSGLHIGVIFGVLTAIFKKIGLNRFVSTVLRILFIAAFAGVCNFTPSSVRAVVMCSVSALASCSYRRYDSWNALSVSAILILLINPFSLFDAGFILSFGAMLGIILLSHSLYSVFRFLPQKIRRAVAVGWSAQFATVPALLTTFGYVSFAGLVLNLVFIPVVSALYIVLFALAIVCLIMPFAAPVLLPVATTPIQLLINLVYSAGFENAVISGDYGLWLYVPFFVITMFVSDKFNFRPRFRGMIASLAVISLICTATIPSYGIGTSVTFSAGYKGGYAVVRNGSGTVLIVTGNAEGVPRAVCEEADSLVIVGGDDGLSALFKLDGNFDKVYISGASPYLPPLGSYDINYTDEFKECGIEFKYNGSSLTAQTNGLKFSVITEDKGEDYGITNQEGTLCLYCYGNNDAVLFGENCSYNLAYCGKMKYNLSGGESFPAYAIPKE